jgi:hypothetical protein
MDASDPYTFLGLKRGVLRAFFGFSLRKIPQLATINLTSFSAPPPEYVQIKPLLALLTVVLKATGTYRDGSLARDSGYTYVSIAYNLSVTLSLYCLAMFWVATNADLKPYRPMPKVRGPFSDNLGDAQTNRCAMQFLSVKGIIFFSFVSHRLGSAPRSLC